MKKITLLELFSGIGGFSKGLMDAGFEFKKHYFSEIDKHAIANYKYNFKDAEYIGSVTDVRGSGIERPNIITFGSPCQDFSLAGKRKGMEGQRSSLILHAIRLIRECRPDFFIWENVKGAYSSNAGADFWGIIQAFTDIGGYRLEWQLLNTSWFLPQNRERIYLVGHLAKTGRDFKGIFPISEVFRGINEGSTDTSVVRAITAGGHSGGHHSGMTLVKHRSDQPFKQGDIAPTIRNSDKGEVRIVETICVAQRGRNPENPSDRTTGAHTEQRLEPNSQGTTNTLTGVQKDNLIMVKSNTEKGFEEAKEGDSINFSNPSSKTRRGRVGKGKAQTLDTACNQGVITNYGSKSLNKTILENNLQEGIPQALDLYNHKAQDISPTLTEPHHNSLRMFDGSNIRRLTEIECERLQGFPDNWTEYGIYEKQVWIDKKERTFKIVQGIHKIPKTQRYKLCGNAVSVPVVKAVVARIKF